MVQKYAFKSGTQKHLVHFSHFSAKRFACMGIIQYFCPMKWKGICIILIGITIGIMFVFLRKPIITGEMTKQTVYLWLLNAFHPQATDAHPTAMLIDDDSGDGIYRIRQICNEIGIKATFAVIPSRLDSIKIDSLRKWQEEGYGIAIHGFNHDNWKDWTSEEIKNDISQSENLLRVYGLRTNSRYIVPPHACNTHKIRKAIHSKGYLMITGANIINPDMTVFQYGRFSLYSDNPTIEEAKRILIEAYKKKAYVILGTHSSMEDSFSEEKTKEILKLAKEMGFRFI